MPFYIGIGLSTKRAYSKKNRNKFWKHIVAKSPYEIEILFDNLSWEEACEKEKEFIKLYGRRDIQTGVLVNLTDGGDGVYNLSESAKYKIGCGNRGRVKSQEERLAISRKLKNRIIPKSEIEKAKATRIKNNSYIVKEETKRKLSELNNKKVIRYISDDLSDSVIFNSIKEAQLQNNLFNISGVCNGKRKTCGGYKWKFL